MIVSARRRSRQPRRPKADRGKRGAQGVDLAEVARLYDLERQTIAEIARHFGWSYAKARRLIDKATQLRSKGNRRVVRKPCGTKQAYQQHLAAGEEPDEACKRANADYTQDYNRRTGNSTARGRAHRKLAKQYPDEYTSVQAQERARARQEDPAAPEKTLASRANQRAYRALAERHTDEFAAVLEQEKKQVRQELDTAAQKEDSAATNSPAGLQGAARLA